jgi:tetratricopeptide (TPR) repeat protein
VKRDPHNPRLLYLRALAHLDQWKPTLPKPVQDRILERAAEDLKAALRLNSQHYLCATLLTDVSDRLGREDEALKAAQQAVRSAPQHEEARLALALHLHRWQHFAAAEKAYIWASSASLRNQADEFGWGDGYQQLLKDAAARR